MSLIVYAPQKGVCNMSDIVKGDLNSALIAAEKEKAHIGIGTYNEKTLHTVLKHYFEPDTEYHEMPLGRKCADISNEFGIIEIQTRSLNNLRSKLDAFLTDNIVTIVYPYAAIKWLCWLDPDTGEITKKRKSPRKLSFFDAFYELYKIRTYLTHPNLKIYLIGLEIEEIRLLNGWSDNKKKGSTRLDRYPISVKESLHIKTTEDFIWLIPENLPSPFTSKDYAAAAKVTPKVAACALSCLCSVGVIEKTGKNNRRFLYELV